MHNAASEENMTHQCSVCLKQFEFVSKLRRHQLTHSGQRPFTCSVCRKAFRQSTHLKRHLESHMKLRDISLFASRADDSQLSCTNSEENYGLHLGPQASVSDQTVISENNSIVQSIWYNTVLTRNDSEWKQTPVENHVRDHGLSVSPSTQNYAEDTNAKKHMDFAQWNFSELGDMAEAANDCPQKDQYSESNRTPDYIQPEITLEKQEQPSLICNNAGQSESMINGFYRNIPPAKMEKLTHQCSVCLKAFSAPSKLRRHMLIHTSQRPFGCQICTKAFRQLTHLKIHMTTHFSQRKIKVKNKSENVPSNSISQNQGYTLSTSMNIYPPLKEQWSEENEALEDDSAVTSSKENNTNVELFSKEAETMTLNSVNIKEKCSKSRIVHECPLCLKCFSAPSKLRRHCLSHTGQRPFQCSLCCRAFRQRAHLKAHYSVHVVPRKKRTSSLQLHRIISQPQTCSSRASKARIKHFVCNSLSRKFRSTKYLTFHQAKQVGSIDWLKAMPISMNKGVSLSIIRTNDKNILGRGSGFKYTASRDNSKQGHCCTVCLKCFSAPSKLRRHILVHTGQRPFRCLVCSRAFTQRSHLKVHRCKGESRGTFCGTLSEMRLHKQGLQTSDTVLSISNNTVRGRHPFICDSRGQEGTDYNQPVCYTKCIAGDLATASKNVNCSAFETSHLAGMKKQTKESGHQCTICMKIFDFPSKLLRHSLIHMDVKPFTCAVCSKSFRQLCHLQSHLKVHTVKKKVCQGTYKQTSTLKATAVPETSKLLIEMNNCTQGSENLSVPHKLDPDCMFVKSSDNQELIKCTNDDTSSHSHTVEELPVPCPQYTEKTSFTAEVRRDSGEQHTISPPELLSDYSSKQKDRNKNQCTFCLKTFDFPSKLSRHLLTHTGIRPFACQICSKSFKQLSHLQCHQWVHSRKDRTTLTDDWLKHQDSVFSACATVSGPCAYTEHQEECSSQEFNPSTQCNDCSPSSSNTPNSKIKSETNLQEDRFINPTFKHEAEASVSLVWDSLEQETVQSIDPDQYEQGSGRKNSQGIQSCVSEDRLNRSSSDSDCCRVGFGYDQSEQTGLRGPKEETPMESSDKHITEPPNDLPICPVCSCCFDTLKKLHTHKCPVQCPEKRLRKSYQCAVCFKSFEAPSKLKRHYVIHTGQRPFQCNVCDRAFTQSGHLKTHMLSHR